MFRIVPPPLFEGPIPNMENIVVQNNPLVSSAMQTCLQVLLTGLSTVALLGLILFGGVLPKLWHTLKFYSVLLMKSVLASK